MKYLGIASELADSVYPINNHRYHLLYNDGDDPSDSPKFIGIGKFQNRFLTEIDSVFCEYSTNLVNKQRNKDNWLRLMVTEYRRKESGDSYSDISHSDMIWELTDSEATIALMDLI